MFHASPRQGYEWLAVLKSLSQSAENNNLVAQLPYDFRAFEPSKNQWLEYSAQETGRAEHLVYALV